MDQLLIALRRVRRRLFVQQWLHFVCTSFLFSLSASLVYVFAARLFPAIPAPEWVCLGLMVAGVLTASYYAWARRPGTAQAALAADARLRLKERFTSSLELAQVEHPMVEALHADARAHLANLNVPRDFPFALPRPVPFVALVLIAFGLAYLFLPEFDLFGFEKRKVEARAKVEKVQMEVERLRNEAKELEEALAEEVKGGAATEAAQLLDQVADMLERGEITEKQALAKMTDLHAALEERQKTLAQANPMPKLATTAQKDLGVMQDIANNMQKGQFGDAAEKARELQKKLEAGNLSKQELEAMAQNLSELADLLGDQNLALSESLGECAKCLSKGDAKSAAKALEKMNMSLEDLASVLEQLDQMAKACKCLGGACKGLCKMAGIGPWKPGESNRYGLGMGGPGKGQGGGVGDLPDVNAAFQPSALPGQLTEGKMLFSIDQRAAPEEGAEPGTEILAHILPCAAGDFLFLDGLFRLLLCFYNR